MRHYLIVAAILFPNVATATDDFLIADRVPSYGQTPSLENVFLGGGYNPLYNLFTKRLKSKCVIPGSTGTIDSLEGSSTWGAMGSLSDQKTFNEKIDQSVGVEGKIAVISLAASAKLMREMHFNYMHSYEYLYIFKRYLPNNLSDPKLDINTAPYLDHPENFIADCGTEFLSSYTKGAYAIGAIDCATTSSTSHDEATLELGKLSGTIPITAGAVGGSLNLKQALDTILQTTHAECHLHFQVAGGAGEISTDKDKFISSLSAYVQNSAAKPVVLSLAFQPYAAVAKTSADRDFFRSLQEKVTAPSDDVENFRARIEIWIDDIEQIERLMSLLSDVDDPIFVDLLARRNRLLLQIKGAEESINKCAEAPLRSWPARCGMD